MPRSSSGVAAPFCPHFHIPASGRSLESHVCSEPCPASGKKRKALACKRVALISACGTGLAASGSSRAAGGGGGGTRGETRWQPPSTACSKGRSISLPPGQVDGVKGPMQSPLLFTYTHISKRTTAEERVNCRRRMRFLVALGLQHACSTQVTSRVSP